VFFFFFFNEIFYFLFSSFFFFFKFFHFNFFSFYFFFLFFFFFLFRSILFVLPFFFFFFFLLENINFSLILLTKPSPGSLLHHNSTQSAYKETSKANDVKESMQAKKKIGVFVKGHEMLSSSSYDFPFRYSKTAPLGRK